jgi:hypothetical protein
MVMKQKKQKARLQRRIRATESMISNSGRYDSKVKLRLDSGGYRVPGSPKQGG